MEHFDDAGDPQNPPITVRELVAKLSALENQDAPIMVEGYEGNYEFASRLETVPVNLWVTDLAFMGPHDDAYSPEESDCVAYVLERHK